MRLFTGDGYTCYSESDDTTTDEPRPRCVIGVCWCPDGWEFRDNACVRQEGEYTTIDYHRDCKLHENNLVIDTLFIQGDFSRFIFIKFENSELKYNRSNSNVHRGILSRMRYILSKYYFIFPIAQ